MVMSDREVHHAVEQALATLMRVDDPAAHLQQLLQTAPAEVCAVLSTVDPASLTLASRLVVRLRFERLVQGSPEAESWFEQDPSGFAAAFRRYHADVPATSTHPTGEASQWRAWGARDGRLTDET